MNNRAIKTLFTIDLLRGQGIPPKSGPADMAVAVITAAVPILVVIIIAGLFMRNKIVMSMMSREIAAMETKTSGLSDAIAFQKAIEQEKAHHNLCLSEVKSSIGKFNQWSPVLTLLVENMPSSVALTELEIKQDSVRKKVPKKDNPKEMIEINVPVTVMSLKMCSDSLSNNDEAVKIFRDYLRNSPLLSSKLDKVSVSKESGLLENRDVAFYLMNCTFKSGS